MNWATQSSGSFSNLHQWLKKRTHSRVSGSPQLLHSHDIVDLLPDPTCILTTQGEVHHGNSRFHEVLKMEPNNQLISSYLTSLSKEDFSEAFHAVVNAHHSMRLPVVLDVNNAANTVKSYRVSLYQWELASNGTNTAVLLTGRYCLISRYLRSLH